MLLQVSQDIASQGYKVLYASGEESESQIRTARRPDFAQHPSEYLDLFGFKPEENVLGIIGDMTRM